MSIKVYRYLGFDLTGEGQHLDPTKIPDALNTPPVTLESLPFTPNKASIQIVHRSGDAIGSPVFTWTRSIGDTEYESIPGWTTSGGGIQTERDLTSNPASHYRLELTTAQATVTTRPMADIFILISGQQ